MANTVGISITADASEAVGALDTLQGRLAALSNSALQASRTMQQMDASYVATFKNNIQIMVDAKQLSLQQALGFDIDYSAQVFAQEQTRLATIRDSDTAILADRQAAVEKMRELDARYVAQTSEDYRRLADAARSQADHVAQSYETAFARVGDSVQHTFNEILTRQTTWAKGMNRMVQEVDTFFLEQVESMAAKWAASGLASLAGGAVSSAVNTAQGTGASGLGAGLTALLGIGQPGGLFGSGLLSGSSGAATASQAAAVTANTTALGTSTAAITALTTALTGATAADSTGAGASLAGGAASAGAAAGGGGFFSWLGGLFAFAGGGIVPSAAGGWAVPNFAGATPALLHAREMVLPADISQGLQGMIGSGGAGDAHFHAHFHGPADGPAISRWFRDNLKGNAGALRDLFRQNALTPRNF